VSISHKFVQMFEAIALFAAVFGGTVLLAGRSTGKKAEKIQAAAFLGPAVILLTVGLLYPAVRTIYESFRDANSRKFIGFDNYHTIISSPDLRIVLRNTALWVVLVPLFATSIGLLYAVLVDRARAEAFAKSLVFLPMAISFVGASIIWKFVYDFRPEGREQIGLANKLLVSAGAKPYDFILSGYNTLFLIVILVWIQAGFAMTILSAALKAIPDDVIEAARLDGVNWRQMFRHITLPSLRPALVVVVTTVAIGTLKIFDIVRTMTGGQFRTSVIANEFFNQSFVTNNGGLGAALAVVLFILVVPIILYNVRQLRKAEHR
jgi:alpha-glucoside transport system permease protein